MKTKKTKEQIEKELFDMAYNWGRINVVVDEKCNAFQLTLKEYQEVIKRNEH